MHKQLREKLESLIQEEQKTAFDPEFLDKLNSLAAGDPLYSQFSATERNTLNEFFREVRNYLFQELLSGVYGSQVLIDAIIVLSFEVGYKLAKGEIQSPPS
jgi:hypothetical protein